MKTVKREVKTETGQEEQGETDEGNRTPDKRWEKLFISVEEQRRRVASEGLWRRDDRFTTTLGSLMALAGPCR